MVIRALREARAASYTLRSAHPQVPQVPGVTFCPSGLPSLPWADGTA